MNTIYDYYEAQLNKTQMLNKKKTHNISIR